MGKEEYDENGNNNNDNNNNNDDAYEMNEEELLAYHKNIVSTWTNVFGFVCTAMSIILYIAGEKLPESSPDGNSDAVGDAYSNGDAETATVARAKSEAYMEILTGMWKMLSTATLAIFSILFVAACILARLDVDDDGRRREEDEGTTNLILILVGLVILSTCLWVLGHKVLGATKWKGTLGVGLLSGGTVYFGLLLFVVFVLFFNPSFEERRREDGPGATVATAFASLFFSLMYCSFGWGTIKYQSSFIDAAGVVANSADVSVATVEVRESGSGDFQRMDSEAPKTGLGLI